MPGNEAAARGRGPAAAVAFVGDRAAVDTTPASIPQALRSDPRYQRLTECIWRLGPRPVGELLLEVSAGRDLIETLETYCALDPRTVAIVGARDWPPVPMRAVA
jgi:hypothetical protein